MKIDINYNNDCIEVMREIPENSIDLVIADPPYWKVVGEKWDYQWKTEKDYVEWSLKWIKEVSRILRLGGTFYCFGYFRTLSLIVPYLEEMGLELRQQIILDKGMRSVSGRATKKYKMFPNVTESILYLSLLPIFFFPKQLFFSELIFMSSLLSAETPKKRE